MTRKIFLHVIFLITLTLVASAQATKPLRLPAPTPEPPPGDIEMLDGYTHVPGRGIDSRVGEISKSGGMAIRYDIGMMAGFFAGRCLSSGDCQWYKGQTVNGREVLLSLTKDGKITATFRKEYANFSAQTKSPEDVADFLIMVLTYKVKEPLLQDKTPTQKPK